MVEPPVLKFSATRFAYYANCANCATLERRHKARSHSDANGSIFFQAGMRRLQKLLHCRMFLLSASARESFDIRALGVPIADYCMASRADGGVGPQAASLSLHIIFRTKVRRGLGLQQL
jgi:hypothetical protein